MQSEYSLWRREPEGGLLAACAELGTAFVACSPLGRAFLTVTVDTAQLANSDLRKHKPRFSRLKKYSPRINLKLPPPIEDQEIPKKQVTCPLGRCLSDRHLIVLSY